MNSNRAFKINVYRIVFKIFKYGMQEMTFVLGALPLLTATGKSRKFNNIKGKKKKMNSQMFCSSRECSSNNLDCFQQQPDGASQDQS